MCYSGPTGLDINIGNNSITQLNISHSPNRGSEAYEPNQIYLNQLLESKSDEPVRIPLELLVPTQMDDKNRYYSDRPIQVYICIKTGKIRIQDGHHRFYYAKENNYKFIWVVLVEDPHIVATYLES